MRLLEHFSLKNPANLYSFLWILYYLQGSLYPGGMINKALLSLFIVMSLYFFVKVNQHSDIPSFIKVLNVLVALFTVYGTVRLLGFDDIFRTDGTLQSPTIYLKSYYMSLLPIYSYFYFAKTGRISDCWIRKWSVIFFVFAVFQYFSAEASMYDSLHENGVDADLVTNNMGYYFVSILCLLPFFEKKPVLQYLILAVCGFFAVSSAKRGAMVCFSASAIVFLWYNFRHSTRNVRIALLLLSTVCILGIFQYTNHLLTTNSSFASRMIIESGNSGGREVLYKSIINYLKNENSVMRMLFGNGADGSIALFGNFAHNDWLEFAVDMGLLGVFSYLCYFIIFIKTVINVQCKSIKMALLFVLIPCMAKSIFSMSIGDFQIIESAVLAYCLANHQTQEFEYVQENSNAL